MVLIILLIIASLFVFLFLESFLVAFLGFNVFVIIFFFLFKRVDWKILLPITGVFLSFWDVVNNLPLGSSLLVLSLLVGIFVLSSILFSTDSGLPSVAINFLIFSLNYILLHLLPSFFVSGRFGLLTLNDLLGSLLRGFFSVVLYLLLEYVFDKFRNRGNTSKIRLK